MPTASKWRTRTPPTPLRSVPPSLPRLRWPRPCTRHMCRLRRAACPHGAMAPWRAACSFLAAPAAAAGMTARAGVRCTSGFSCCCISAVQTKRICRATLGRLCPFRADARWLSLSSSSPSFYLHREPSTKMRRWQSMCVKTHMPPPGGPVLVAPGSANFSQGPFDA